MSKGLKRGSRLGKYRIVRRIGDGGSATVWHARDTVEGRDVAVKVVSEAVVNEFGRSAVEYEARVASQLEHPRIVAIRNADWVGSRFLLVTELARCSLEDFAGARRSARTALSVVRDVAAGLAHAQQRGLIHRDIKPANVLIFKGGVAKLGDFGTARLAPASTHYLTEVGTFGYMAPEQAYARPRFASDVFSLALTAYELLSGKLPSWPFEWPLEGHERFAKRCPVEVQSVIRRGLHVDLKRRWKTAIEFHDALESALVRSEKKRRKSVERPQRVIAKRAKQEDPFVEEAKWFRRTHGKTLQANFDCHRCGGPISEAMKFCPWCGTTHNSFIEVTPLPLVCPDCERGVMPEWRACPWCSKGRFEANGKAIRPDPRDERPCRNKRCDTRLRPFMRYCPACKTKVIRPWRAERLDACARCRWPVARRWRMCAWCGRKNQSAMSVR